MSNFLGPGVSTKSGEIWKRIQESKRLNFYSKLLQIRDAYYAKNGIKKAQFNDQELRKFEQFVLQESKDCYDFILENDCRTTFEKVLFYPETTAEELYESLINEE